MQGCVISKHYQKYKNFIDYSIIMSEISVKFKHNSFIELKVV